MSRLSPTRRAAIAEALESLSSKSSSPGAIRIVYSTPSNAPSSSQPWPWAALTSSSSPAAAALNIAVLDSSFNPPTRAHLSLADSPLGIPPTNDDAAAAYDAHLLLFSVRNADKGTGRPGDAGAAQRVEMMELLAHDLESRLQDRQQPNVAVAIVEEPLIFDKSTLLHRYFSHHPSHPRPRLHWVVGFDTLLRVFDLKYYPSRSSFESSCDAFFEGEQGTRFVCARRGAEGGDGPGNEAEAKLLSSDLVKPWVDKGAVVMLDLPAEEGAISSTRIRKLLTGGHKSPKLRELTTEGIANYLEEENVYAEGA